MHATGNTSVFRIFIFDIYVNAVNALNELHSNHLHTYTPFLARLGTRVACG